MPSWMRRTYSDSGLMLVDDPRRTVETLCQFGDRDIDRATFKTRYEGVVGERLSKGTSDARLYNLVLFGLLDYVRGQKTTYRPTLVAKELCGLLRAPDSLSDYRRLLAKVLLHTEPKKKLFEDFVRFVSSEKYVTQEDVHKKFREEVARTLIAWSEEAGLIGMYKDRIWAIPFEKRKRNYTVDEFWNATKEAYSSLQQTKMFGLRRLYVPIGELRAYLSPKLELNQDEFSEHFRRLKSSEFGERIKLYGGPPDAYEFEDSLSYKGKSYLFFSLKRD